jgi:hypothetical protein
MGTTTMPAPISVRASCKLTDEFRRRMAVWIAERNGEWLDAWTDWGTGERPGALRDLLSPWQANGHLVKWGMLTGRIDPMIGDRAMKPDQRDGLAAAVYFRSDEDRAALIHEMNAYVRRVAAEMREKVYAAHPELRPEEYADPEWCDVVPEEFVEEPPPDL